MSKQRSFIHSLLLVALVLSLMPATLLAAPPTSPILQVETTPNPLVAIHVSESTEAHWPNSAWNYFVLHESIKEALRSDGTPFVEVSDADIAAGVLLKAGGTPRYPIVISLAAEVINDNQISPLRDYVAAGGFLLAGSSAFTRNPDGSSRGDFALADEMGIHSLDNWYLNNSFSKVGNHRILSHIPGGSLSWRLPLNSEEIPWGVSPSHTIHGNHYAWQVSVSDADIIAGGSGGPLITTKSYGQGQFIYQGELNPLVGHGAYDPGMYAYLIFRKTIEWAFEAANLPIIKLSPWQYQHDAAFVVRHDFENTPSRIRSIKASAQAEHALGVQGDYFFCTGTLRVGSEDTQMTEATKLAAIADLQDAVQDYGATIGSHNGGLKNPVNDALGPSEYNYWHWGPDEALDETPAGYADGKAYAKESIQISFEDIEGWLAGLDNGRPGCGSAGDCPRVWVSPYFNSTREGSYEIMEELGVLTMGEQKVSPFPHWTLSTQRSDTPAYSHLTLPASDWYIGSNIAQSMESGHTSTTIHALVDFYHELGALVNLYNHSTSAGGLGLDYITYASGKDRMWSANAVSVYDWWTSRSQISVTPTYRKEAGTAIAEAIVSGATDPDAAIELVIPNWAGGAIDDVQVLLDGSPADPADYRATGYGIKIKVGNTVSDVEVRYTPLEGWVQTDWQGGSGQAEWADESRYLSANGIDDSVPGQVRLAVASGGDTLFADDFSRPTPPPPVPFDWIIPTTSPTNGAVFDTDGGVLNATTSVASRYGYAYTDTLTIDNHSVEADIRFTQAGTFGGGIFGRLNTTNGQRYAAWIYPEGSSGVPGGYGPAVIKLIKYYNWGSWGSPLGLQTVSIPNVGSGWHHLKLAFNGNQIQVFYDDMTTPLIDTTDDNAGGYAPYASGYPGVDYYSSGNTYGPTYNNFEVRDGTDTVVLSDDFGPDAVDPILPWVEQMGSWQVTNDVAQAANISGYSYMYTTDTPAWTDYTVEGRIQFQSGAFGGGIGGRVNPTTGAHYAAWVYPDGSSGGSNMLKLIKFRDWTSWNGQSMGGGTVSLPSVGTGWHTLKMSFEGNRIRVYFDGDLKFDVTDDGYDNRPAYTEGGISVDTWSRGGSGSAITADDMVVRTPSEYGSSGTLLSSAFDGGVGVKWQNIAWNATTGDSTGVRVRTRAAARSDQLAAASWSDWYPAIGSPVTNQDRRWIQYELELTSSNPAVSPVFFENGITYIPGIQLPGSNLTYTGPGSADSESTVDLSASLQDDNDTPLVGRTVDFTLDGVNGTLNTSATTDGAGLASPSLSLMTAPGTYSLTVAFAGDSEYAPVATTVPFDVTSPWQTWVQDTENDFNQNVLTDTDTIAHAGSVRLEETLVGAGEETGDFAVNGVSGWSYRRRLLINNQISTDLPTGYSVKLVLDTAGLVSSGKLQTNGDDLRVVWQNGSTAVELDRVAETAFNSAGTEIWFKTQAPIPGDSRDGSYYIYYGNPAAGTPPADPIQVYALWDDFNGSALDTSLWNRTQGTVTISGGLAQLASGANIIGTTPYTHAQLDMRIQLGGENNYIWWGWEEIPSNAANMIIFEESSSGFEAWTRNDNAAISRLPISDPSGGLTQWHTYTTDWWPGHARWLIDGAEVESATDNVPDTGIYANFSATYVPMNIDWVKARLRVGQEPLVSLATPQLGYPDQGQMLSAPYDTGQFSGWKYLTWESTTTPDTNISLQVRTAATQNDLPAVPWTDYGQTGRLINNSPGRWIQYLATLTTTNPYASPELHKVTVHYLEQPTTLTLAPITKTVAAGEVLTYTASVDDGNNNWDVTPETNFTIDTGAGGLWAGNIYTSELAGTWPVSGTYLALTATGALTVTPTTPISVEIKPGTATVQAGESLTYTAVATDSQGNSWSATETTVFTITREAGGLWGGNVYTSEVAGTWIVTGTYDGLTDTAELQVNPAADLALEKTAPTNLVIGQMLTYTISITNSGPSAATSVMITDTLPSGVTFDSVVANQGQCYGGDVVTCTVASMPINMPMLITLTAQADITGAIVNTATVAAAEPDPTLDNNTASATTVVVDRLTPILTGLSPDTVAAGSLTFTLSITGTGFVDGAAIMWNDIPLPTTVVSSTLITATVAEANITTPGLVNVTVVNPAPRGGTSNILEFNIAAQAQPEFKIYLPIIMADADPNPAPDTAPDLVVSNITVTANSVTVVIKNQGNDPVTQAFWVDLYVNPRPVPTGVNEVWNDGRASQGIVWGVAGDALPLEPDQTITLSYRDAYFWASYSNMNWPLPANIPVYVQADSANTTTSYGAIYEVHEILGGPYNNISHTTSPAVTAVDVEETDAATTGPAAPPVSIEKMPERP